MTVDDLHIRKATADDVQAIVAILGSHWPGLTRNPDGLAAAYERRMADGDRLAWVAELDGQLVAAVVVDLNISRHPRVISRDWSRDARCHAGEVGCPAAMAGRTSWCSRAGTSAR